ncbi:MAG: hypothetical protein H6831_10930 [Planctomycetes bacterium]|nr:hypothetical protein [Planctomycetota bacterium]MCB9904911.1 hypothetical protein [Planctomycetota bacterium]
MTPRPKNMLEAFQASTHAAAQEPAPTPTPVAPPVKSPGLDDLPPSIERRQIEPILAVAAGALLLVLAFFLGRFSVGKPALAANDDSSSKAADADYALDLRRPVDTPPPVVDQPATTDDTATEYRTEVDRSFLLPESRVTVCAQRYGKDEQTRWEADYWRLKDLGLPVVLPVSDRNGKWIVLCVGAEPKKNKNIEDVLKILHAMPDFSSAYVDNIDNVFKR